MVFLFVLAGLSICICHAEEIESTKIQSSKPKTSSIEKSKKNEDKNEKAKKSETNSEENKNQQTVNEEPKKETPENKISKKESSVPKMNSILPEKSTNDSQKSKDNIEKTENQVSEPKFDLPEISESEIKKTSTSPIPDHQSNARDMPKTIFAWILIATGIVIILATIILNLKISQQNIQIKYHEKHGAKINKRKNKYRLKYK